MIVQGGNTFLAHQGGKQSSHKSERDSNDFQDFLAGAHKKKVSPKKEAKKSHSAKKKIDNSGYDENQATAKRRERPVKKMEGARKQRAEQVQSKGEQPRQPVQKVQTQEHKNNVDKKFAGNTEEGTQLVDSLNLSGVEKNTLEKNQSILQNQNNSFENMMAQMKMQAADQKQQTSLGQGMETKIGVLPNMSSKNGSIKLGAEFDLSQGGETLSLNAVEGASGLNTLSPEGGESSSDSSMPQLDSLINQYLEQDSSVSSEEGVTFADSLNQAEGGKSERVENMQSIIKQARAFVDDGGGTMEIHLQPEGLGKVQLKVAVNDGQVNVEMMADNMAAKKALEEGLFDIKQALEGQKLAVETLKVEMSPDYQKDFSDLTNHMQEQANRDFAEQFLGQFRQQREEKFGGMFDSFRNFQPGAKEPELTLSRNPYTERGKGRSVNLVA